MSAHPTTLVTLPLELLRQIAQQFEPGDRALHHLAFTCHHLYGVIGPVQLKASSLIQAVAHLSPDNRYGTKMKSFVRNFFRLLANKPPVDDDITRVEAFIEYFYVAITLPSIDRANVLAKLKAAIRHLPPGLIRIEAFKMIFFATAQLHGRDKVTATDFLPDVLRDLPPGQEITNAFNSTIEMLHPTLQSTFLNYKDDLPFPHKAQLLATLPAVIPLMTNPRKLLAFKRVVVAARALLSSKNMNDDMKFKVCSIKIAPTLVNLIAVIPNLPLELAQPLPPPPARPLPSIRPRDVAYQLILDAANDLHVSERPSVLKSFESAQVLRSDIA